MPTRPGQNDPERVAAWEMHRREVGERIRAIRIERGVTQEALALKSGVTRNVQVFRPYVAISISTEVFNSAKSAYALVGN